MKESFASISQKLTSAYDKNTPLKLKLVDIYLLFIVLTGVFQFVYCVLVGTFPYNSFLAGFSAAVGSFVLALNLRIQWDPTSTEVAISKERAFAEFTACSIVLYFFVVNFLG